MSLAESALAGVLPDDIRIVDSHTHLGYYPSCHIHAGGAAEMIAAMDALGVERCAISSFLALGPDIKSGNDEVAQALRSFPGRFIGYAVVNPRYPDEVVPELKRCFDRLGITAIKLHPAFHRYDIRTSICESVFAFADERRCAILSHDFGDAAFLGRVAAKHPNARFIPAHVAHDGFARDYTDYLAAARDSENVFLDLAFSVAPYRCVEKVAAIAGADKILYGSDSPMLAMSYQIGKFLLADIDDEAKREILSTNARKVFGLE